MAREYAGLLWKRIAKAAGLPKGQRYGWHALRRMFATELKEMPLRDLAHAGGWKSVQTILVCYQQPDLELQRRALGRRTG
ncbi:MAG TPA: tyrosine-type recombinase/integrase [Gemmatimonadaceae bacterium]|nr:tyrosine-type recombinase/integrase [Gemmatimonadaceae bacterium]